MYLLRIWTKKKFWPFSDEVKEKIIRILGFKSTGLMVSMQLSSLKNMHQLPRYYQIVSKIGFPNQQNLTHSTPVEDVVEFLVFSLHSRGHSVLLRTCWKVWMAGEMENTAISYLNLVEFKVDYELGKSIFERQYASSLHLIKRMSLSEEIRFRQNSVLFW